MAGSEPDPNKHAFISYVHEDSVVLVGRCRLLFVVPGRHGDQVIGRRRPSRCLFGRSCGRAVCSRLEAQVANGGVPRGPYSG